jgi:hypothetical protein
MGSYWGDGWGKRFVFDHVGSVDDCLDELCSYREDSFGPVPHVSAHRTSPTWTLFDTERSIRRGCKRLRDRQHAAELAASRPPEPLRTVARTSGYGEMIWLGTEAFPGNYSDPRQRQLDRLITEFCLGRQIMWFECDACQARGCWWFAEDEDLCPLCGADLPDDDELVAPARPWPLWAGAAARIYKVILSQLGEM